MAKKFNDESLVTFDEIFLVRTKLNRERIKLWLPPYTVNGEKGDIPVELIARFSNELSMPDCTVLFALEKLRCHALAKLKAKETFESTGVATLNLHLSWMSETNEKDKMDIPLNVKLDEDITCICQRLSDILQPHNFGFENVKLIHKGSILQKDVPLWSQNVTNGANIMVMLALKSVADEENSKMEVEDRVSETRKLAEALAKRVDAGSGSRDHYFLEIRNQQGEKMNLPEAERQSLSVALTLHEKGRILMKEKDYVESLLLFLEADQNFCSCSSDILKAVDNYALLCLDIVWCYFSLQKLEYLPDAEERLKKCKDCFIKSYGPNMERLNSVKGNYMNEMVLFVRLHIMEAISYYLHGNTLKATESLNKAEEHLKNLQIDDEKLIQLITMGFSMSEARLSLRACKGDITVAIEYISRKREEKRLSKERDKKEMEEHKLAMKYGKTASGDVVDSEKLRNLEDMGFTTKKAAYALIQSNNDINGAIECLYMNISEEAFNESAASTSETSDSTSMSTSNSSSSTSTSTSSSSTSTSTSSSSTSTSTSSSSTSRISPQEEEENEIDERVNETLRDISKNEEEDYLDLDLNEEAELVNKYRILIASLPQ